MSLAYVPPMQAFWVRLKEGQTAGTLTFSNSARSHADNSMNVLKSQGAENPDRRPLLRLSVTGNASTDETVIYADPAAQYGFDTYDSDKMFSGTGAEIFTLPPASLDKSGTAKNDNKLVINGIPTIAAGMEIPLGFQAGQTGIFTFRAKEIRGLDTLDVFLHDRYRRVEYDLRSEGGYDFTAGSMPVTDRFGIVFRNAAVAPPAAPEAGSFLAYADRKGRMTVLLSGRNVQGDRVDVSVFDVTGRKLTGQAVMTGEKTVLDGVFKNGVYVLRADNRTVKLIVRSE
ncbi:MAG: T9SS type A sorting domain-containing protein [Dysgonamonadaceae bacterium]|nr:T9SS type A sorting domain-containing protein [Dysgonamonadaceae bacterium]